MALIKNLRYDPEYIPTDLIDGITIIESGRLSTTNDAFKITDSKIVLNSKIIKTRYDAFSAISRLLNNTNLEINRKYIKRKRSIRMERLPLKHTMTNHNLPDSPSINDDNNVKTIKDQEKTIINISFDDKIGSGGFGSIYKCNIDGIVIKLERNDRNNTSRRQFNNEINFYEHITSNNDSNEFPNVPEYHGNGTIEATGERYLVLEKYDSDIRLLIKNKLLDFNDIKRIVRNVIDGLKFIHNNGYIHGDIKAGNILIKSDKISITDFGLCQRIVQKVSDCKTRNRNGTLIYMSTLAHRGTHLTPITDFETLGWCLIEWFGGKLPWRDERSINKIFMAKNRYRTYEFINDYAIAFLKECNILDISISNILTKYYEYVLSYEAIPYDNELNIYRNNPIDYDKLKQIFD